MRIDSSVPKQASEQVDEHSKVQDKVKEDDIAQFNAHLSNQSREQSKEKKLTQQQLMRQVIDQQRQQELSSGTSLYAEANQRKVLERKLEEEELADYTKDVDAVKTKFQNLTGLESSDSNDISQDAITEIINNYVKDNLLEHNISAQVTHGNTVLDVAVIKTRSNNEVFISTQSPQIKQFIENNHSELEQLIQQADQLNGAGKFKLNIV